MRDAYNKNEIITANQEISTCKIEMIKSTNNSSKNKGYNIVKFIIKN